MIPANPTSGVVRKSIFGREPLARPASVTYRGVMHVALACGGTGGHAFPGVATARVLRERGHVVTLWLAGRESEASVIAGWDGPVERISVQGFGTRLQWGAATAAIGQMRATARCWRWMRRARVDVFLGMGSYSTVAPALAARALGVPIVLHEANAIPGRAVAFLAHGARAVGIVFPCAEQFLPPGRARVTGLPMRDFDPSRGLEDARLAPAQFTVLAMGGSQGAHALNEAVPAALARLRGQGRFVQVIHLSGRRDEAAVRDAYARAGVPHVVFGFYPEIGRAYHDASLAVCRSGAGTCMELAKAGVPALMVPLPSARRNHQLLNALAMREAGGARVLPQAELTAERLAQEIATLMDAPETLASMRTALGAQAIENGAARLADLVESVAAGR